MNADLAQRSGPPAILTVDDETSVLDAVAADLRARYGASYRIVTAGSGAAALAAIERLTRRGTPLALVVADQRMPQMTGTSLLVAAKRQQPHLRSVLLTAYADTDAAITAINDVDLDHYIVNRGIRPKNACTRCSTSCSRSGTRRVRVPMLGLA